MNTIANKTLLEDAFGALAHGDGRPFFELLADDVRWTLTGTSAWSKTYLGKKQVQTELLKPVFAQFADLYTGTAKRFIAEGDFVVVEFVGHATTKTGRVYNNHYCYICRFAADRIVELTEYMDTQHATATLDTI